VSELPRRTKTTVTMRRGRLQLKHVLSVTAWNACSSCPVADMTARSSTQENRQQRNFSRWNCCVCGTTHTLSDADRKCMRQPVSEISWMPEARYADVSPANDWCTRHASLNSTHRRTGSQCNFCRTGVICSHRRAPVIWRAAVFCADCIFCKRSLETLHSSELQ